MSEGCIRELKHGLSRKFIKTGSPKRLWDHCIEFQALIFSHTAHINYELDRKLPETYMTGKPAEIRNICEYSWYEWVMFRDQPITYPYFPIVLGWYLEPDIDVRSVMTYKILKENGEYVCRTTV